MAKTGAGGGSGEHPVQAPGPQVSDHLVIRASAGSGKTYRLSSRYIALLRAGAEPRAILATTFTRKAAGEILERVLRRLAEAARDPGKATALGADIGRETGQPLPLTQSDAMRLLRVFCDALHQVSISTIDGFFRRVVQCFQPELGVPPDPEIMEMGAPRARAIGRDAVGEILEEQSLEETMSLLLAMNKERTGRSVTENLDAGMQETYEVFLECGVEKWRGHEVAGVELPREEQIRLARELRDLIARTVDFNVRNPKAKIGHGNWFKNMTSHANLAESNQWGGLIKTNLMHEILNGNTSYFKTALTDDFLAIYRPWALHLQWYVTSRIMTQTEATGRLLAQYERHFERLKKREKILFFSDLPRLLSGHGTDFDASILPALYYRLDGRISHILLDEFQDTSPEQWAVLRPLAEEIVAHGVPGASGRSFFCVGDVKQAIYGWRGGCSAIFDRVQSDLHLDKDEKLNKSYRSSRFILEAVNDLFSNLSSNPALMEIDEQKSYYHEVATEWQSRFEEHVADDLDLDGYVELSTSPARNGIDRDDDDVEKDEDGEAENDGEEKELAPGHINFVIRKIGELIEKHRDCSLGLLVRSKKVASQCLTLLRQRGIQASGESGNPMHTEPLVSVMLAALTLADHPGDTAAAYLLETSPMGSPSTTGSEYGVRVKEIDSLNVASTRLRRELASRGLPAMIREWSGKLAAHSDSTGVAAARLERLIEMAEGWTPDDPLRYTEFVDAVEATSVEEVMPAQVRVMTIHKAKGLEFDIVVLPELTTPMAKLGKAVFSIREAPGGPITAVYRRGSLDEMRLGAETMVARRQEAERELDDSLCGLYVAMTRPRQALYMIIPPLTKSKSAKKFSFIGARGHRNDTWAALLRRGLSTVRPEDENFEGDKILYGKGNANWSRKKSADQGEKILEPPFDLASIRLKKPVGPPRRFLPEITPSSLAQHQRHRAARLFNLDRGEAMNRGILMHRWFEQIEWLDAFKISDEELLRLGRELLTATQDSFIRENLAKFKNVLKTPDVQQALYRPALVGGETCDDPWRERSFAVRHDGKLLHGQFDRVVVIRRDGKPVRAILIDYKTDQIANDQDLRARTDTYRPQLQAYRLALAQMLKIQIEVVEGMLLFVQEKMRVMSIADQECP